MSMLRNAAAVAFALLLSACGTAPMNPIEYRDAAKAGAHFSTSETFVVNRSFADVAQTIKKRAPECLSIEISSTRKPFIGFGSTTDTYGWAKPTIVTSREKLELYFQVKYRGTVSPMPTDGYYHLVADFYPVGNGRTRVDIYRRTKVSTLAQAIKGWAAGDKLGCADPSTFL